MTKIVAFFEFCEEIVKVNVLTVMLRGVIVTDQNDLRRVTKGTVVVNAKQTHRWSPGGVLFKCSLFCSPYLCSTRGLFFGIKFYIFKVVVVNSSYHID